MTRYKDESELLANVAPHLRSQFGAPTIGAANAIMRDMAAITADPQYPAAVASMVHNGPLKTKRPKYGNTVVAYGDMTFDSKWEFQRWQELQTMLDGGLITDLQRQVPFALSARCADGSMARLGAWVADFVYMRGGERVIEDAKSAATQRDKLYVWKRRHVQAEHGITITEVTRQRKGK